MLVYNDLMFHAVWVWFSNGFSNFTSGIILASVVKFFWDRHEKNSDRVKLKKEEIGQRFNNLYLEGKAHGFIKPIKDEIQFNKIILDIGKYDKRLEAKLMLCKSRWTEGLIFKRNYMSLINGRYTSRQDIQEWYNLTKEAEKYAEEVHQEIQKKWII